MLGYTFTTEEEAIQAKLDCDTYYGYPIPNTITQHWTNYLYSPNDNIWYIIYDLSLQQVLGQPIEFEITTPNFPI